ncbi:MAG: hypothetical protein LR015_15310 [Verrucomicrobia bacterium]|nr:hypothetical protein [Verrucomicrobiota bacterium]
MDLSHLQVITDTNQWGALLPEILLGVGAVLLLVLELFMPKRKVCIFRLAIALQFFGSWAFGVYYRRAACRISELDFC